ncbi:MAG: glycerophosphodiester phosphodiesterase [Aquincola sp.]|nr:glycerophosphodiester phosphodiesterase [Aquincola sp.]MDH4288214.1 glycerophosphodiester phosphodiesterase [Aquincola sp.]MDH5329810.1 glycerophosphodiester phosphodiesterase [Aquincola sp.]
MGMPRRSVTLLALAVLAAAALLAVSVGPRVEPLPPHPYWSGAAPRSIAHRGGLGLWPENTLYAFRAAAALGVDVLEMDLHQTADDEIVVLHDDTVDRTTDGTGRVDSLRLDALQRLDAGHRWTTDDGGTYPYRRRGIVVPTLRQVFAALPQLHINLEIKGRGPAMAAPLCALIREHAMQDRVVVVAVDQDAIDAFRVACPQVATAATRNEVVRFALHSAVFLGDRYAPRAQVLQVPERVGGIPVLTQRFLRDARRLNLKIEVWTVNAPDDMKRLLALPVDGIMTDRPDRLQPLLAR